MKWLFLSGSLLFISLGFSQDMEENKKNSVPLPTRLETINKVIPEEKTNQERLFPKANKTAVENADSSLDSSSISGDSLQASDTSAVKKDSVTSESQKTKYILKTYKDKAVSGETGYNSLVGTGIIYHYFAEEHISIEAGFGGSSDGFTPGVRGRMEIGVDPIPYWAAIGLSYSFGSFIHVPVLDKETRRWPKVRSLPIPRLHLQLGTQIKLSDESFVLAYIGYSLVLTSETWKPHPDDVDLVSDEGAKFFDSFFGSGPSIGVAFGMYPF